MIENKRKIVLMRHGDAGFDAARDFDRELTMQGEQQTRDMGRYLATLCSQWDLVLVSPYRRAQQSWQQVRQQIWQQENQSGTVETLEELTPMGDPTLCHDLILAYAETHDARRVLVISHMPLVGELVAEMVPGQMPVLFHTGSIAEIDMASSARLVRQLAPHQLD